MKKLIAIVCALLIAPAAYARCTTTTVISPDGRVIVCTTCCYGSNCTTTCV